MEFKLMDGTWCDNIFFKGYRVYANLNLSKVTVFYVDNPDEYDNLEWNLTAQEWAEIPTDPLGGAYHKCRYLHMNVPPHRIGGSDK